MTHRCGKSIAVTLLAATLVGGPASCSMPANPWRFADPPTRAATAKPENNPDSQPIVVVVGRFDDPSRAPNYSRGVGRAMSDAFSRALMRHGGFEVRISEPLAAEAGRYARFDAAAGSYAGLTHDQERARDQLARDRADVDYVILGKVTDFYHTRDLPDEASRRGLIGRRNEAIVSVDLRIVDMQTMQVIGTDHLMGSANAGRTRSHELYENVALDSYVFWNTPLGRAGRRAIDRAVNRAAVMMPADRAHDETMLADDTPMRDIGGKDAEDDPAPPAITVRSEPSAPVNRASNARSRFSGAKPQILRVGDSRRVTIMGGRNIGVEHGDRFHIVREVGAGSADALVNDAVTGRPLRVAIIDVAETTSTGWLLGQKPRQLDLRGMVLHLPTKAPGSATVQVEPTHTAP